ncbi:MAG TPA: C4-type zinc ribbon domain-containing protein [Chloroflexota bacterium]|nr:C4-type zinc ribbon domain-containing protein [Chloroflexota bacterium]
MKKIELLRELQEVDSALDRAREGLEQRRARCGDDAELVPLRESQESTKQQLHVLQSRGKELDHELEKQSGKLKVQEKKLYDGSVKNPKELSDLSKDAANQKAAVSQLETQVLENMDAVEVASLEVQRAGAALDEKEKAWRADQGVLEQECAALESEIERLNGKRSALVPQIDPPTLRLYESIRRTRGGLAVVPIEQRTCRGCRISLSSSEIQRARTSVEPITCQSCGRILYLRE